MMCCEPNPRHASRMRFASSSCCCCFPRQFISPEERKEQLEKYRDQLKKELGGVEQALEEIK